MTNLTILTQSDELFNVTVEVYDPVAVNEQINNNEIITIRLGDMIFSRLDIKRVNPVEQAETPTEGGATIE